MSFDFSSVKGIKIPVDGVLKDVKQIQDSNGTIIWRGVKEYTITVVGNGFTYTGAGTYEEGTSYTVTLTANSNYCFTSYDSGGSGSNSFTCDNVTRYRTITYTGTLTDNITINATAVPYYSYTLNDGDTHTEGSLTFNANSQVINLNDVIDQDYYFTSSLYINIYIRSRKVYSDYSSDDRIITGVSGISSSTIGLGTLWLGSGTGYDNIRVNRTISSNASTVITAVDSSAGKITNNSYCTAVVTNSSSSKSYSVSSSYGTVITLYCEYSTKSNNSISLSNKDTNRYNYSGEGSFEFGDSGSSPTTRTLTRSIRYYSLTFNNDSGNTVTSYFRIGSGSWSSYSVSGGGSRSISTTYNNSISVYFKYGSASSSIISRTMTSDQTVAGDCSYTAPSWSNTQNIKYQLKASINSNSIGYFVNSGSGGGDAEDVFNRPSNATHIRFVVDGTTYDVPLPSDLPSTFYDWSSDYYSTSSAGGKTFEFERQIIDDEDDSYIEAWVSVRGYSYTQVNLLGTSYYAHYNEGYYSCWWN